MFGIRFSLGLGLCLGLGWVCACTTGGRDGGAPGGSCSPAEIHCDGRVVLTCRGGTLQPDDTCMTACVDGTGCTECVPNARFCIGDEIHACRASGDGSTLEMACMAPDACVSGVCTNACDAARANRSNVGCEYWAVDLDNEYGETLIGSADAANQQFAVAIANTSTLPVRVVVERNDVPPGSAAPAPFPVAEVDVPPLSVAEIPLPQREVDGSVMMRGDGPGTFLSSNAYRITTNYPVVAYQFNPIEQDFSNDASLLIPTSGLDSMYRVIGWPTANPISGPFMISGIPDHSFVTIVGVQANTSVTVTLGGPIVGGGGILATAGGGTVTVTLSPFDVLNLESDGAPGDMSGTVVTATAPVVVFSGGERAIAPYREGPPPPPGWTRKDPLCCTDHLEEQVFPVTAWGQDFVVTRSPIRSSMPSWREPDIYRVQADKDGTTITTNLPAPFDSFTLNQNEWREFWADRSFVMRASEAVQIEQILVSQLWVGYWRDGHGGDPSMILFPPCEQYREDYMFLTPSSWTASYVVVSIPDGATVMLDGQDVATNSACVSEMAGMIDTTGYVSATCPVEPGVHRIEGTLPVGITVYGYYSRGSYGYTGGSNFTRINLI